MSRQTYTTLDIHVSAKVDGGENDDSSSLYEPSPKKVSGDVPSPEYLDRAYMYWNKRSPDDPVEYIPSSRVKNARRQFKTVQQIS